MGAKGKSSHRDPPFLPWGRKEESRGAIVGSKRPGSLCQYLHWAKGPVQGRTPPRPGMAEDKGNSLSLREAFRVTPWNRKSTKTKKDNRENKNV